MVKRLLCWLRCRLLGHQWIRSDKVIYKKKPSQYYFGDNMIPTKYCLRCSKKRKLSK